MIYGGDYESWHVFGVVRTTREKMRRTILETRMHPVLSCWCVVATVTLVLAAWQENIRPKMYVQLGECLLHFVLFLRYSYSYLNVLRISIVVFLVRDASSSVRQKTSASLFTLSRVVHIEFQESKKTDTQ